MFEVVLKEIREMMRGYKPFAVLTFYLLFLLAIFYLISPRDGREVLRIANYIILSISVFLSPPIASATISLENERKTLKMLIVTPLKAKDIVVGKLLSALMMILLLVIPTLPFIGLCFLLGGVSPSEVLIGLLLVLSVSFGILSLSLLSSLIFKRVYASNAVAYGFVIFFLIGTVIVDGILEHHISEEFESVLTRHLNPFFTLTFIDSAAFRDMWWLLEPLWLNTVAVYTAIGAVSLAISLKFFDRFIRK